MIIGVYNLYLFILILDYFTILDYCSILDYCIFFNFHIGTLLFSIDLFNVSF
jgi:hypothetical protein